MGAEIPAGAVLVARAITNSSLWTMRPADRILAITCICMANWKPKKWFDGHRSTTIGRGQFVTSYESLAEAAKLSVRNVRTSVQNLEKAEFLTRKPTRRWTLITLCKYDHYQDFSKYYDTKTDTPLTNDRQTTDKRLTTTKEREEREEREESQEEGAHAPARLPDVLGAVEEGLRKARPESPGEDPVFKHLWDLAQRQHVNAKPETLRRYLKGWIAQKGAQVVEEFLSRPDVVGKDVKTIQDYFFNSMKKNGFV